LLHALAELWALAKLRVLAKPGLICSSWPMHFVAASFQNLLALSARSFVLAGNNNNRANNNANRWRALA
jgi:hypothetical protein